MSITNYKEIYDVIYANDSLYNHEAHDKIKIVLDQLSGQSKNIKIVDIGCGKGYYSRRLIANGFTNILGIEVSKVCSENFLSDIPHINADFLNYSKDLEEKSYQVSLCMDVLEHIDPNFVDIFLSEIHRISDFSLLGIANHSDIIENIELHLIQEDSKWWTNKIQKYWSKIELIHNYDGRFFIFKCIKKLKDSK